MTFNNIEGIIVMEKSPLHNNCCSQDWSINAKINGYKYDIKHFA